MAGFRAQRRFSRFRRARKQNSLYYRQKWRKTRNGGMYVPGRKG